MDAQAEIEDHEAAIARLRRQQQDCQHVYGEPYRDVDKKMVPRQENRPMGSDFFNPVTVGFDEVETPVWRKKCTKCGLTQTTTKTEPIVTGHKPVF